MNCPVCPTVNLAAEYIEPNLRALVCEKCGGKWIAANSYDNWRTLQGANLPEKESVETALEINETQTARLCPACRHIMLKYNVGRGAGFMLDRCGNCAGVWFDRNEWETLKAHNLHDDLREIFSEKWQSAVRREETKRKLEQIYTEKFGAEDFEKIRRFKSWLDAHNNRDEILAFLSDSNPLEI